MAVHTGSHLWLGAVTGTGPCNDSPGFTPALTQAAALLAPQPFAAALADAAYDAEAHHRLCHQTLGIRECLIPLNPRSGGRRWPQTPYRRAQRRHRFPRERYHQRWHVESAFSQHKRRLGAALTARHTPAQRRELVLRVLVHNVMILHCPQWLISTEQDRL